LSKATCIKDNDQKAKQKKNALKLDAIGSVTKIKNGKLRREA
jgi:hypothetical protein